MWEDLKGSVVGKEKVTVDMTLITTNTVDYTVREYDQFRKK